MQQSMNDLYSPVSPFYDRLDGFGRCRRNIIGDILPRWQKCTHLVTVLFLAVTQCRLEALQIEEAARLKGTGKSSKNGSKKINEDRRTERCIMRYLRIKSDIALFIYCAESFNIINYTNYFFWLKTCVFPHPPNYKLYLCTNISYL